MHFVRMTHPDIDGTASCTADAFHLIYEAKGWQIAAEPAAEQPAETPLSAPEDRDAPDSAVPMSAPVASPPPPSMNLLES